MLFQSQRCAQFEVQSYMGMIHWGANVRVYGLDFSTVSTLSAGMTPTTASTSSSSSVLQAGTPLQMGNVVTISAGYQNTGASLIYDGFLFQSVWTKENTVDSKLTLRCDSNLFTDTFADLNFSMGKGASDLDVVNQIVTNIGVPIANIDATASTILSNNQYSRGQVIYGKPFDQIKQIMRQNLLWSWMTPAGLIVSSFRRTGTLAVPDFAYGPPNVQGSLTTGGTQPGTVSPTLIGFPEQTQDGIVFQVQLDSRPQIGDLVQVAPATAVNGFQVTPGVGRLPPPNQQGLYYVVGIRHVGDTRGGEGSPWFTEITGVTQNWFLNYLAAHSPLGAISALVGLATSRL